MNIKPSVLFTAIVLIFSLTLVSAQDGITGLTIALNAHESGSRWAWQVASDHASAPLFGMTVTPFNNVYCQDAPGVYTGSDVVYQIGMNTNPAGSDVIDDNNAGISLNWESRWVHTDCVERAEWQVRGITADGQRVRFYHTELCNDGSCMHNLISGDNISLGQWRNGTQIPTVTIRNGATRFYGTVGFNGESGPGGVPNIDMRKSDAEKLARVIQILDQYGLALPVGP